MTTYVAFSTAWPLRKSNAIALHMGRPHTIQHDGALFKRVCRVKPAHKHYSCYRKV